MDRIYELYPRYDENGHQMIRSAYGIASIALKDHKRSNGNPFIEHPDAVAKIAYEEIGLSVFKFIDVKTLVGGVVETKLLAFRKFLCHLYEQRVLYVLETTLVAIVGGNHSQLYSPKTVLVSLVYDRVAVEFFYLQ